MASPSRFSWVNYTSSSVVEKDEEDLSIIKSHAKRLAHRRRRDRHSLSLRQGSPSSQKTAQTSRPGTTTLLTHSPSTDWKEVAICEFLADFVYPKQTSPITAFQYFTFIPSLYSKDAQRSCLTEAVSAVALARYANKAQSTSSELAADLSARARSSYTEALSLVNKSISVPQLRRKDDLLAALCLLTKYDLVIGDEHDEVFLSHERGQAALVREREPEWLQTEVGVGLFRLIYLRHLLNCLALGECPSIALDDIQSRTVFLDPSSRQLMALVRQGAILCYNARVRQHPTESARVCELHGLVRIAAELDAAVESLDCRLPLSMRYQSRSSSPTSSSMERDGHGVQYEPDTINIFRDLQHVSFWHVLFNLRLHLLQTRIKLGEEIASERTREQLDSRGLEDENAPLAFHIRLQATVNDICASVPHLPGSSGYRKAWLTAEEGGSVAAHYLIWLLAAAASVPGVPSAQKAWIYSRLFYIGHGQGIREALSYA